MHYKYIVKDFIQDGGFVYIGSLNMSDNAFLNNYEDLVFTSSKETVAAFHNNYQLCWNYIKTENQTLINRVLLDDAEFI